MPSGPDACVSERMRRHFIQLDPHDSLLEAERTMRMARVRVLPVVEEGALAGMLSHRRLLEASLATAGGGLASASCARWMRQVCVSALMDKEPEVVTPGTSLQAAIGLLVEGSDGCVPVVAERGDRPTLVGILTEGDLLRAAYESPPSP